MQEASSEELVLLVAYLLGGFGEEGDAFYTRPSVARESSTQYVQQQKTRGDAPRT